MPSSGSRINRNRSQNGSDIGLGLRPRSMACRVPPEIILVVEDDVLVRLPISEYLRQCGYRVLEAANADEALRILKNGGDDQVDVVLTDIEMPGSIEGFGLSKWIRA